MSWKQYGGIYQNDKLNNIKTKNLFAESFGMETSYKGDFDISGGLNVDNSIAVGNSVVVGNSVIVGNIITSNYLDVIQDCNVYGNTIVYTNLTVVGNLNASNTNVDNIFNNLVSEGTLKVTEDTFLNANTYVKNTLFFNGNTDINAGILQVGGGIGNGASMTAFSKKIGVNMNSPAATFDICGNSISTLNVYTTQNFSRNVIVQNAENRGIVVNTDVSSSYIEFYNDNAIAENVVSSSVADNYNARIKYSVGGNLNIDASRNILMSCPLSISANSTVGVFQSGIYNNSAAISGNCVNLVAKDDSSTTFMNIVTPNIAAQKGISIGGGAFPGDVARSMGTLGWFDVSGYYNSAEMIVSGNINSNVPSTVGFNTFSPKTDNYCLDINGPVHINNGIVKITGNTAFDVKSLNIMNRTVDNLIAVGSASEILAFPFIQNLYYSTNRGKTWNLARISPPNPPVPGNATDLETNPITFNSCFSFDATNSVIVGDNGYIFYTANGGALWNQYAISTSISPNQNYNSVFIDSSNIIFGSGVLLKYFVRVGIIDPPVKITISGAALKYVDISSIVNYTQLPVGVTASLAINSIYGYDGAYYIAGGNSIIKLVIDSGGGGAFSNSLSFGGSSVYLSNFFTNATTNYKSIYAYDANNVVAVGENIITWTNSGGIGGWTNVVFSGVTFNSVFVYDSLHAIAVGDSAVIYITRDGYVTWNIISAELINSSGCSSILLNSSNNFKSVSMPDLNTAVISSTIVPSSGSVIGNSILIYCYLPNLFNNVGNFVLDISGSMQLAGNLLVENTVTGGVLSVQRYINSNMYEGTGFGNINIGNSVVMDKTISIGDLTNSGGVRNTINIGGIYDTINIGNSVSFGGNSISIVGNSAAYFNDTFILGNLTVSKSINYIAGNATVYGVTTLGNVSNIIDSSGVSTGTLVVKGGVGVTGNIYTGGSVRFLNNTNSSSASTGGVVCSGGVGIMQNLYSGGNINVGGAVNSITGNLVIGGNIGVGGNFSIVGNVVVNGDSLGVLGNTTISGNLVVSKNALFSGAVTHSSTTLFTGATTNTGGILGGGNIITTSGDHSTSALTGAIVSRGGVGVGGNVFVGGNTAVSGNLAVSRLLNVTGAATHSSTTLLTGATTNTGGILGGGNIITTNGEHSTSALTGAIVSRGGAGVGGNVFVGGNTAVSGNLAVTGLLNVTGAATHSSTTLLTGATTNTGGILGGGNIITTNGEHSTSALTGAIVSRGGAGVGGNVFVGGNTAVSGNLAVTGLLNVTGAATHSSTTLLTGATTNTGGILGGGNIITTNGDHSTSALTGAIVSRGGAGVGGNVFVGGNTVVSGNLGVGIGLTVAGGASGGGTLSVNGTVNSTGFLINGSALSTTVFANQLVGNILSANVFTSTLTSVGTLTSLTVSGAITNSGGISGVGAIETTNQTHATSVVTGAIICGGGVGVTGNAFIGGNITTTNQAHATSAVTGAIICGGGIGVTGNTFIGGNIRILNSTQSTSTSTGSIICSGGLGLSGNIFAGGTILASNIITGLSFNATSDYRIKSNIQQIENTIDILKPIKYFNIKTQKFDIGFLAHELQEHYPYLVSGNKDEVDENGEPVYQSINYIGLIGILVKEIQNMKTEIKYLRETMQNIISYIDI